MFQDYDQPHYPMTFLPKFFLTSAVVLLALASAPPRAQAAGSDAERLQKLERAVELLQQRNADLEREVSSLKKSSGSTPRAAREIVATSSSDGKSVVEKTEVKEEKQPVFAIAAATEFKLTLGGFI